MNILPDFEELLRLIEEHGIEYMIVGGYAVAYHGYPHGLRIKAMSKSWGKCKEEESVLAG